MDAAIVSVHGSRVGQLDRVSADEDYVFHFDRAWLEDPDRPALGQLFEDRRPDDVRTSGLPCWFAHLLPQGPWRRHLQRWAGLDADDNDDLDLLIATGGDLPGAVVLSPATPRFAGPGAYAPPSPPGPGLCFSLAGAQTKLSVKSGERGLVVPVRGEAGAFIAKFHDPMFPGLPRLEHATTEWARQSGVRVHAVRLARASEFSELPPELPLGDHELLLATRFDRTAEARVHAEDFGQVLDRPPGDPQYSGSYEQIGKVLAAVSPTDVRSSSSASYSWSLPGMVTPTSRTGG